MFAQQGGRRRSVVAGASFSETRTTGAGSFIVPAGYTSVEGKLVGPGAGGSRSNSGQARGGGGGAKITFTIALDPADAGASLAYVCGIPGAGRAGSNGDGFDATDTTLNIDVLTNGTGTLTCAGAKGGKLGVNGVGGIASGSGTNVNGGNADLLTGQGGTSADGALGGTNWIDPTEPTPTYPAEAYGGGGAAGARLSGIQYSGGDGAIGIIQLTWVP